MDIQTCPHCGARVMPTSDGTCPSCRHSFADAEEVDPSPPSATPTDNPYVAPATSATAARSSSDAKPKEPFSLQAAKFSVYAPFVLVCLGFCVQGPMAIHQGTDTGVLLAYCLGGLSVLTTLAAFVLGWIGLVGGVQRRAAGTILLGIVGILLNTGTIILWATTIHMLLTRTAV